MLETPTISTTVSSLLGRGVVNAAGERLGRVKEFVVEPHRDHAHVSALVLQHGKGEKTLLQVKDLMLPGPEDSLLRAKAEPAPYVHPNDFLLLDYDLLDQQIIDVDGRKVVRVNDVNLAWEVGARGDDVAGLLIQEVEVGTRGASRRLFKGLPVALVDGISERFQSRVIPWGCVDLIERDPARRVRLKIGQDRLAKLHPSDIASILEELAPAERDAVFSSLDEETAAEALEEVDPEMQKALLQGMDSERAAEILEEMDPGAAADVLGELSDEESEAILEEMEPEERQDIEELLEFEDNTAAALMTTDYLGVPLEATVFDAVQGLREFEGDPDNVTEIYLLGEHEKLVGVVTLSKILLAPSNSKLADIKVHHMASCTLHARHKEVAELFDKYNLRSLPVVNAHGVLAGVIHAEHVIAQLLEE